MTITNKTLICQSYLVWKSTSSPIQWASQTKMFHWYKYPLETSEYFSSQHWNIFFLLTFNTVVFLHYLKSQTCTKPSGICLSREVPSIGGCSRFNSVQCINSNTEFEGTSGPSLLFWSPCHTITLKMPRTAKACTFSASINFLLKVFYVPTRNGHQIWQNYEQVLKYPSKFSNVSQMHLKWCIPSCTRNFQEKLKKVQDRGPWQEGRSVSHRIHSSTSPWRMTGTV